MERPAPVKLRELLIAQLHERQSCTSRVLNIGAGAGDFIENFLAANGCSFTIDRLDVDDCRVEHPNVQACYRCSVENMDVVQSDCYDLAFANYVLEHVEDLSKAASEICRVLKPGGVFIATVPNTTAPEFIVARHTPLWFHRLVRGGSGWETHYSYGSIPELCAVLERAGLETVHLFQWSCVRSYLRRFPVLKQLAVFYDWCVSHIGWKRLMGDVCLASRKSDGAAAQP